MRPRPARPLTTAIAAALALAGCGGGTGGTTRAARTSPTAPAATAPASTAGHSSPAPASTGPALPGAGTDPVVVRATDDHTALLTGVRAARHDGYDRVVFEFRDALPGYDVRYTARPVREDGSGTVVSVDGSAVLQVRMDRALDADLSKPSAPPTYTGPTRIAPEASEVVQLVRTGGFEGVLTWVVGLRDRVPFRVSTLDSPPRLVVDLRSG